MRATDIQKLMLKMFVHMRVSVGVVGILLPVILVLGGKTMGVPVSSSLSAYYHATEQCAAPGTTNASNPNCIDGAGMMRNWFVGILFFIGMVMFALKGFSLWENIALDIAGVMAPCVAIFPMAWPPAPPGTHPPFTFHSLHTPCAMIFFVCISFTAIVCSEKTLKLMPPDTPDREKVISFYRGWYWFFSALMVGGPGLAWLLTTLGHVTDYQTLILEWVGITAFGSYWLFKTWELDRSDVEGRAMRGELKMDTSKLT